MENLKSLCVSVRGQIEEFCVENKMTTSEKLMVFGAVRGYINPIKLPGDKPEAVVRQPLPAMTRYSTRFPCSPAPTERVPICTGKVEASGRIHVVESGNSSSTRPPAWRNVSSSRHR